jgi:Na+(H+)/acetate symporter ActP
MSLLSRRASRLGAFLGAIAGSTILAIFYGMARFAGSQLGVRAVYNRWLDSSFAVSLAVSLILMLVVTALGAPVRAEHEDLVHSLRENDD